MRTSHPIRWILGLSLAVNLLLLGGIMYLKVPAIHGLVLPFWKAVRGIPATPAETGLAFVLRDGQIALAVAEDKCAVTVTLPDPESATYFVALDSGDELRLGAHETRFAWTLHDGGSREAPNRATVWMLDPAGRQTKAGEVEIYRVSEGEGEENLGVEREDGWLFVGRCTFEIVASSKTTLTVRESRVLAELTADERARIASSLCDASVWKRDASGVEGLLENLGRASAYVCSSGLKYIAPTNNELIYSRPPSEALLGVVDREIGLQCQGFRSVFVWVALSCGWLAEDQIREVDLFRYDEIAGLDTTSHALLEVRSSAGGWLAFDPLAQVVFADESGRHLSAEQIAVLRRNRQLDRIEVVRLSELCSTKTATNALTQRPYWTASSFDDRDSANYNYWCTFSRLVIRSLHLPD